MLRSYIDFCDVERLVGWATIVERPTEKPTLDVVYRDTLIGQCVADIFRDDLLAAGIADGRAGFELRLPPFIPKSELRHIRVRVHGSGELVGGAGAEEEARTTPSLFGGLWIDRDDFADVLAGKRRQGAVDDALADTLTRFVRDGYVVLEGAVSDACVSRLNAEIDRVWEHPPDGLLIETWEPDGAVHFIPPDPRYRAGATKLLDIHACSAVAREAIAAPDTIRFLRAVFEEAPKAFQTLTFYNGSQQAMHKDSAYVKVENPMHMAATWLALEDVQAGAGELEYFVGSHRAPDFLFGRAHKWMENSPEEHPRFLQSLHDDAAKYGHERKPFLAKRGDVLVWHADLAHGGSAITKPGVTRKSLVTHFTGASDEPYYRRAARHRELEEHGCVFVSQHGDVRPA